MSARTTSQQVLPWNTRHKQMWDGTGLLPKYFVLCGCFYSPPLLCKAYGFAKAKHAGGFSLPWKGEIFFQSSGDFQGCLRPDSNVFTMPPAEQKKLINQGNGISHELQAKTISSHPFDMWLACKARYVEISWWMLARTIILIILVCTQPSCSSSHQVATFMSHWPCTPPSSISIWQFVDCNGHALSYPNAKNITKHLDKFVSSLQLQLAWKHKHARPLVMSPWMQDCIMWVHSRTSTGEWNKKSTALSPKDFIGVLQLWRTTTFFLACKWKIPAFTSFLQVFAKLISSWGYPGDGGFALANSSAFSCKCSSTCQASESSFQRFGSTKLQHWTTFFGVKKYLRLFKQKHRNTLKKRSNHTALICLGDRILRTSGSQHCHLLISSDWYGTEMSCPQWAWDTTFFLSREVPQSWDNLKLPITIIRDSLLQHQAGKKYWKNVFVTIQRGPAGWATCRFLDTAYKSKTYIRPESKINSVSLRQGSGKSLDLDLVTTFPVHHNLRSASGPRPSKNWESRCVEADWPQWKVCRHSWPRKRPHTILEFSKRFEAVFHFTEIEWPQSCM